MRRLKASVAALSAVVVVLALAVPASSHEGPHDSETWLGLYLKHQNAAGTAPEGIFENFTLLGHNDLGGYEDFGDVAVLGNYAYVGSRCGHDGLGGHGVQVVGISNPANPTVVSTLPNPVNSRAEDVVVRHVSTPSFTGDLAAVGIQICFSAPEPSRTGMMFYDVTNPPAPRLLGMYTLPRRMAGCHEVDLMQRTDGRVLAGCAHNLFDQFDPNVAVDILDVTNPAAPVKVGNFTRNGTVFDRPGIGCFPARFAHSVRFYRAATTMFVSYWDAGTVNVDITDPSNPTTVSVAHIAPPDEDGENHSMTPANDGKLLLINPEDFSPFDQEAGFCGPESDGWGEVWIVDNTRPEAPRVVGNFGTPNSNTDRTDGIFTAHNSEVVNGTEVFSSWYSDGIVWWKVSQDGSSFQKGHFVPRNRGAPPAIVWGVAIDSVHNVILASDIVGGLWIVRPDGLGDF